MGTAIDTSQRFDALDAIRHPKKRAFLEAYSRTGTIMQACEIAGIGRFIVLRWRTPTDQYYDADFASEFKRAGECAGIFLEERAAIEADRRAIDGTDHPVIHQGVITDTYKEYSDNLLMFRLKKLNPEYRDNQPPQTTLNVLIAGEEARTILGQSMPGLAARLPHDGQATALPPGPETEGLGIIDAEPVEPAPPPTPNASNNNNL